MKTIHIEFSDERLITPSGLVFVGQILGKSSFVKKINRAPISSEYLQKQIKNGDILLTYIGMLCQEKPQYEAVREMMDDPDYYKYALGISYAIPSAETLRQRFDMIRDSLRGNILQANVDLLRDMKIEPSALENGYVPVDIDVTPFDNSKTKKEDVLVNSLVHKNYKEDVPVEIRVYLDQIQIINFSEPDHYIDMEKFAAGKVRARRYRNPKSGEFFKEIDLSEKKSTGISKILRELKGNGSPLPEFETDADRTYMITTIKIHEGFEFEKENFGQKNERSLSEVYCLSQG